MTNYRSKLAGIVAGLFLAAAAQAHTVWLEPAEPGAWWVKFNGHNGVVESADPAKLRTVEAIDARGAKLGVTRASTAGGLKVTVNGTPALIAVHFDNGTHSRRAEGPSVEKPMNEVPGAVKATRALKYHKTIVSWQGSVAMPIGQPFEVVPLGPAAPRAGQPMKVRVLLEGKPVAGVRLGEGEDGKEGAPSTGADGVAEFVPRAGLNRLWAGKRIAVTDHPGYTELSYEYLLGFTAQ